MFIPECPFFQKILYMGTSKNRFEKRKCVSRVEDEERLRRLAGLSVSPSVSQARHLPAAGEITQGEET